MELIINKFEDLNKLTGWMIDGVGITIGANPVLTFQMHHPAAACPIKVHIIGDVSFGRSGNVFIINPTFQLKTEDVIVPMPA